MKQATGKKFQPEQLEEMIKGLWVYVPQMSKKALVPVGRDEKVIFDAQYSELEGAEPGDMFVLHRGRLLMALFTMAEGMIMVEMPADSAFDEQPLK